MRTLNFRDNVLWAIAYKLGLDPTIELLKNQADALASYINAWVRRLWDSTDWPEWTVIGRFSVQTAPGLEHIVGYNEIPIEYIAPPTGPSFPDAPAPGPTRPLIGKVLKVYLADPRLTRLPVDTPFRLEHVGIHVGFEHGNSVWIKYVTRAPMFTATQWLNTVTYAKDQVVYSPVTGECYISKSSGNLNHDPSVAGNSTELLTEETLGTLNNPGLPGASKLVAVSSVISSGATITDPPFNGDVFYVEVRDDTNTLIGSATHTSDGATSLFAIYTDLRTQLVAIPALSTFTITVVPTPVLEITLQDDSDFSVYNASYARSGGQTLPLGVSQSQAYIAAVSPTVGTSQGFTLTIVDDQIITGSTYQLTFTTIDNEQHVASYVALPTDNAQQVLQGLIDAIVAAQTDDAFFFGVQSSIDTVSPNALFSIDKTIGEVSMDAIMAPPGQTYWDIVLFPFALADQVVRGAYADALREGGQSDKGDSQEQAVPTENAVRTGAELAQQYDVLTDQQQPKSRYQVK